MKPITEDDVVIRRMVQVQSHEPHKVEAANHHLLQSSLISFVCCCIYSGAGTGKKKAYADEEDVEQPSKTLTYVCLVVHMDI